MSSPATGSSVVLDASAVLASLFEEPGAEVVRAHLRTGVVGADTRGRNGGHPYKMPAAELRLAQAAMGQPSTKVGELCVELGITRQTLYRHVDSKGRLRLDGEKLLGRKGKSAQSAGPAQPLT